MNPERFVKAFIFDLDDTLYLERDFVKSGFKAVAGFLSKKYDLIEEDIYKILVKDFNDGLRERNFNVLLEKLGLPEKIDVLVQVYQAHKPKIHIFTDAKEILEQLNSNSKLKTALLTDGLKEVQRNKINALNLHKYFDVITLSDDYGRENWKPSIVPFEKTLEKLDVSPSNSVYVGDNPLKDFTAPKKLGMMTIHVIRKEGEYSDLKVEEHSEPDYVVNNLLDIKPIIPKSK